MRYPAIYNSAILAMRAVNKYFIQTSVKCEHRPNFHNKNRFIWRTRKFLSSTWHGGGSDLCIVKKVMFCALAFAFIIIYYCWCFTYESAIICMWNNLIKLPSSWNPALNHHANTIPNYIWTSPHTYTTVYNKHLLREWVSAPQSTFIVCVYVWYQHFSLTLVAFNDRRKSSMR